MIRLVLGRVALLVGLGVVLGCRGSLWACDSSRPALRAQPRDPVTLTAAAVILGGCGALAGWLPARRASRIDPASVLRE